MALKRYANNPILRPKDVPPSRDDYEVIGVFNAAAIRFKDEILLLLRVAERPVQNRSDAVRVPLLDTTVSPPQWGERVWLRSDPDLDASDPRGVRYKGRHYLTSVSHLRLARSQDGYRFTVDPQPALFPTTPYEAYGLEDPRITQINGEYWITYVAVSEWGVVTALAKTADFETFQRLGVILYPENKNVVMFPGRINGRYAALHRPGVTALGDKVIWVSDSPDGIHWGNHRPCIGLRPGHFDAIRVGACAVPIRTPDGWLEIYHGVDTEGRYHLGAALLDLEQPEKVLARSREPLLSPTQPYEVDGFYGNVVFSCGAVEEPDGCLRVYYGCADERMAVAEAKVDDILATLTEAPAS